MFLLFVFTYTMSNAQNYKNEIPDAGKERIIKSTIDTYNIINELGIKRYELLEGVYAYPNPIRNTLNIEMPDYNNYEISMFNRNGKRVFKRNLTNRIETSFDLYALEKGFYFLSIVDLIKKKAVILKVQKL